MLHCSPDAPFDSETGDENARHYSPISEDQLVKLGFDYHLAGHYHSAHKLQFDRIPTPSTVLSPIPRCEERSDDDSQSDHQWELDFVGHPGGFRDDQHGKREHGSHDQNHSHSRPA
jgi:hypothetical protein